MAFCGILSNGFGHLGVRLLVRTDPVSWMSVQATLEMPFVELFQELDVVWEELFVPPRGRWLRICTICCVTLTSIRSTLLRTLPGCQ